jgi:hypothetical protein
MAAARFRMIRFVLVWIAGSTLAFLAAWGVRSWFRGRVAKPWRMHLPGLLVLCALAGAAPAFLYDWLSARPVPLPPQLQQTPPLDQPTVSR